MDMRPEEISQLSKTMKSMLTEAQCARWIPSLLLPACLQSCSLVRLTGLSEHLSGEFPAYNAAACAERLVQRLATSKISDFFQYKY